MNTRQRLRSAIAKTKRLIEFVAYGLFDNVVLANARTKAEPTSRTIAVVCTELMGDYFIWLPYGLALAKHLRQQGLHVVFVCNQQWLELAQRHYADVSLVPINRKQFTKSLRYRAQTLRKLRGLNALQVLNPCYPRNCLFEDAIVRSLGGTATGFDAVFKDRPWVDRTVSRHLYDRLLPSVPHVHQAVHYEMLLDTTGVSNPVTAPLTHLKGGTANAHSLLYFVVSPGASQAMKTWPADRFIEIARKVLQVRPGWQCLLIGAPTEQTWIDMMQEALGPRATSVAGRLTLLELVEQIHNARLVIGNDSGAAHIAAACGTPSLVVSPGAEYGRYQPYDPMHNAVAAIPDTVIHPMDCFGCNWNCRFHVPRGKPAPCVDRITVASVWTRLSAMLPA